MDTLTLTDSVRSAGDLEVSVVEAQGDIDAYTFSRFQERLGELQSEGRLHVVVDCGKLSYISSAGLGILKQMVRAFRDDGGDIRLAAPSPKIDNILKLLGFAKIIRCFATVDEAVSSFQE